MAAAGGTWHSHNGKDDASRMISIYTSPPATLGSPAVLSTYYAGMIYLRLKCIYIDISI